MNITRKRRVPMLINAGADLTIVNKSWRIPFALSKNRSNLPSRKTRITRSKPGENSKFSSLDFSFSNRITKKGNSKNYHSSVRIW